MEIENKFLLLLIMVWFLALGFIAREKMSRLVKWTYAFGTFSFFGLIVLSNYFCKKNGITQYLAGIAMCWIAGAVIHWLRFRRQ